MVLVILVISWWIDGWYMGNDGEWMVNVGDFMVNKWLIDDYQWLCWSLAVVVVDGSMTVIDNDEW